VTRSSQFRTPLVVACVPAGLLLVIALGLSLTGRYGDVPWIPVGPEPFLDLIALTSTSECLTTSGWTIAGPSCDPYGRLFNYPSAWVYLFALFHLNADSTFLVGNVFILILVGVVLVVGLLIRRAGARPSDYLVLSLAAVSPAVLFATERGNVDILILGLLVVAVLAQLRCFTGTAGVVIGLATSLKLFPIGASGLLLVETRRSLRGWIGLVATLSVGGLLLLSELRMIGGRTPSGDLVSYGMSVPIRWAFQILGGTPHPLLLRVLGLALFLTVTALYGMVLLASSGVRQHILDASKVLSETAALLALFVTGLGAFLVSYATDSFDYKMILLLPVVASCLTLGQRSAVWRAVGILLTILMWCSSLMPTWLQVAGDILWVIVAPALLILYLIQLWWLMRAWTSHLRSGRTELREKV
jgi:hypothetical protein